MFKLKPGNVFQKINHMDRKKAYTWGAIIVVCLISLVTLLSFLSTPEDPSFAGMDSHGYDLAQMPFVNDEAEQYLLAAKYPDMKENGSTLLYSAEEKEARQAEDALAVAEDADMSDRSFSANDSEDMGSGRTPTSRGYSGYGGRGGGAGSPTQINQLGSASSTHASGSGISSSWGAPRGDFSPYKTQEKGSEIVPQLKNQNARRSLYQAARGSRAAAGLKEGKSGNAKRAMLGGEIKGSEAFTDQGIDAGKLGGLELDTNAPTSSADLSNLQDQIQDALNDAKNNDDKDKQTLGEKLLESFLSGLVDVGVKALGHLADAGIDSLMANAAGNRAGKKYIKGFLDMNGESCGNSPECLQIAMGMGYNPSEWKNGETLGDFTNKRKINRAFKKGKINDFQIVQTGDENSPPQLQIGAGTARTQWEEARGNARAASLGRSENYNQRDRTSTEMAAYKKCVNACSGNTACISKCE